MNLDASSNPPTQNATSWPNVDDVAAWSVSRLLSILWSRRFLIMGVVLATLIVGLVYAMSATPIYRVEALLQVESRSGRGGATGNNQALITMTEGLYETVTDAMAEMEMLRSSQVLGNVVETQRLDIVAAEKLSARQAFFPKKWRRKEAEIAVDAFEVPPALMGLTFQVVSLPQGRYQLLAPDGKPLGEGALGESMIARWRSEAIRVKVQELSGPEHTAFTLVRQPMLRAVENLRRTLTVSEKGKDTNLINLALDHPDPVRGAQILNSILESYQKQGISRKAEDTSKTLAFLQEQLPILRGKLKAAEDALYRYRAQSGAADLPETGRLVLKQISDSEAQVLALRQRRAELLRTFQEQAPEVVALDVQIAKLVEEGNRLGSRVRDLPQAQQEVVRLTREVEANQGLYMTMLSNIQELQVAKVGSVGHSRIIDSAVPSLEAYKPAKRQIVMLSLAGGLLAGFALAFLLDHLSQKVVHPVQVELFLGIPVVGIIPASKSQSLLSRRIKHREAGERVLARSSPGDLAVESLRSLRTSLRFMAAETPAKSLLFVGASPGVGKSFVCANYAYLLAQTGAKVLLVDADIRKGSVHQYCGLDNLGGGLPALLRGETTLAAVTKTFHGVHVITRGSTPGNPSELLMSPKFTELVKEAEQIYDYIIFDAPPILAVTDATIIASHMDAVFMIARAGMNTVDEIQQSLKRLQLSSIQVSGCILNHVSLQDGRLGARRIYHYEYRSPS